MTSYKLFNSKEEALERLKPSSMIPVKLNGLTICLVNLNNHFYAIKNSCPHLGESLSKGTVNYLGEIVCPWHSFRFNLKSGEEALRRCRDAVVFTVSEGKDKGLYINI